MKHMQCCNINNNDMYQILFEQYHKILKLHQNKKLLKYHNKC